MGTILDATGASCFHKNFQMEFEHTFIYAYVDVRREDQGYRVKDETQFDDTCRNPH